MKKILKLVSIFAILIFAINCDDTKDFEFVTPEDNFGIISPSDGATLILDSANQQNNALTIVWNDNASGSTSYAIEMAMDATFTSPISVGSSANNTFSLTVEELNALLLDYDISALEETTIYFRVSGGEFSDVIKLTLSTYPESNPTITSPDSNFEVVLSDITEDETALTVEWAEPDFSEDTAVIINYYLEAAVGGTDFAIVESSGVIQERMLEVTHAELNEAALNLGLAAEEAATLDVRVRSTLETGSGELERISDFITITVTPYETALPPILYVVGAGAADAGWGWDSPVELTLSGTKYGGNINLQNNDGADNNFRFFTDASLEWGSPSQNFPYYSVRNYTIDPNFEDANDGDNNFAFIGTTGLYYLEIDTENKTITLGDARTGPNCEYNTLSLVGAGVPDAGWGWATPVEILCTGNGIYSGAVTFANDAFRFFTDRTLEWGSPSFNYPYYESEGYTIDANFENANDGDSNFAFVGTPGDYILTINDISKTITLEPIACEFDQLWIVGAGVPDAGWGWTSPVELPCYGDGVYSGDVYLQNNDGADNNFRFFSDRTLEWASPSFNYPYYEGEGYAIDSNFMNAGDGDSNFAFVGTTGTYKLTIDTMEKTITLVQVVVVSCEFDQLWLVGAGVPDAGWGWATPVEFPCTGAGVYSGQVEFANDAFRFFTDSSLEWASPSFNYPYYESEGYTIDAKFENANDGDSNFWFNGTPGTYTLTLDTVNKTIILN